MSFSLDDYCNAFIEEEVVASGRYRSASDVVGTALRLLEDRETRLRALRQSLIAGERSGDSTAFDFDEFVSRKRAENRCERWGDDQAEKYVREIRRALERLVGNPLIGRPCDEVREGYRRHAVGSHTLYHRVVSDDLIDVVRILHKRMDVDRHLD